MVKPTNYELTPELRKAFNEALGAIEDAENSMIEALGYFVDDFKVTGRIKELVDGDTLGYTLACFVQASSDLAMAFFAATETSETDK